MVRRGIFSMSPSSSSSKTKKKKNSSSNGSPLAAAVIRRNKQQQQQHSNKRSNNNNNNNNNDVDEWRRPWHTTTAEDEKSRNSGGEVVSDDSVPIPPPFGDGGEDDTSTIDGGIKGGRHRHNSNNNKHSNNNATSTPITPRRNHGNTITTATPTGTNSQSHHARKGKSGGGGTSNNNNNGSSSPLDENNYPTTAFTSSSPPSNHHHHKPTIRTPRSFFGRQTSSPNKHSSSFSLSSSAEKKSSKKHKTSGLLKFFGGGGNGNGNGNSNSNNNKKHHYHDEEESTVAPVFSTVPTTTTVVDHHHHHHDTTKSIRQDDQHESASSSNNNKSWVEQMKEMFENNKNTSSTTGVGVGVGDGNSSSSKGCGISNSSIGSGGTGIRKNGQVGSGSSSLDKTINRGNHNTNKKMRPIITTQVSETYPSQFESSLKELNNNDKQDAVDDNNNNNNNKKINITTAEQLLLQQPQPSVSNDGDDTTVSNLTNPTYFQTIDHKHWPVTMEEMSVQQQQHNNDNNNNNMLSPKNNKKNSASTDASNENSRSKRDEGTPKSPVMGDFFVNNKSSSMDSWEKGDDDFSDPFFGHDKTSRTITSSKNHMMIMDIVDDDDDDANDDDDDDDATPVFGTDTAFPEFVDEMKTDEFSDNVPFPPMPMDLETSTTDEVTSMTMPQRPPRATGNTVTPPRSTNSKTTGIITPVRSRSRRGLRSMSPSTRRRLQGRSSLPMDKTLVNEENEKAKPADTETSRTVSDAKANAISTTSTPHRTPSPSRRKINSKLSQRYQQNKRGMKISTGTVAESTTANKGGVPSIKADNNHDDKSCIYHVATSPRKASAQASPWNLTKDDPSSKSDKNDASSVYYVATTCPQLSKSDDEESATTTTATASVYKPQAYSGRFSSRGKPTLRSNRPPPPSISSSQSVVSTRSMEASTEQSKRKARRVRSFRQNRSIQLHQESDGVSVMSDSMSVSTMPALSSNNIKACSESRTSEIQSPPRPTRRPSLSLQIDTCTAEPNRAHFKDASSLYSGIFSGGKGKKKQRPQRLDELRHALHRPRVYNRGRTPKHTGPMQTVFDCYDETKIVDPMARAGLRLLSASVVPIQAAVRRFLVRQYLLTQWWAALVIQARFKSHVEESHFKEQKHAVIQIQRIARGVLVWQRLSLEDFCATEIQKIFRGYSTANKHAEKKSNITVVQSMWRAHRAQRVAYHRYDCVILLQAWLRGVTVRKNLMLQHLCATEIQRLVRGYQAMMFVYNEIYSVTVAQSIVRRRQAISLATERMQAIIIIQAAARSSLVRCRIELLRSKAIVLQSHVRRYLAMLFVYGKIYKIIIVQNLLRRRKAIASATNRMGALIRIQTQWRTFQVQRQVELQKEKATKIQSIWRSYFMSSIYHLKISDTITLQSLWRRKRAAEYVAKKRRDKAAVTIQSQWRCYDATLTYLLCLTSSITIQSLARQWHAKQLRKEYEHQLVKKREKAAIVIQSTFRSFLCITDYIFTIADIVIIQTLARRWAAKRQAKQLRQQRDHDKARIIQRWGRNIIRQRNCAASKIQSRWRVSCEKAAFKVVMTRHCSARTIQATWRMFCDWSSYTISLESMISIQALVRGFLVRCEHAKTIWGIIMIQATIRAFLDKRKTSAMKLHHIQQEESEKIAEIQSLAATKIHAQVRGFLARQKCHKYSSARKIQSFYRGYTARTVFKRLQQNVAVLSIQTYWRAHTARCTLQKLRKIYYSSVKIQSAWRGFLVYTDYLFTLADIIKIQSAARFFVQRKRYIKMREEVHNFSATYIQTAWRRFVVWTDYQFAIADYITIQSCVRRWFAKRKLVDLRVQYVDKRETSASMIQRHWRLKSAILKLQKHRATRKIQNCFRMFQAKRMLATLSLEYYAASKIQSVWRGFAYYTEFICIVCDIIKVQSIARSRQDKRKLRTLKEERDNVSATSIQSAWRCYFLYTQYIIDKTDVTVVQSCVRRKFALKQYYQLLEELHQRRVFTLCKIQAQWRSYKAQSRLKMHIAARKVQTTWRMQRSQSLLHSHLTARMIQNAWRASKAREALVFLIAEFVAASMIQATWRAYSESQRYLRTLFDVIMVQSVCRRQAASVRMKKLREQKREKSAELVQKVWRSFVCSTKFNMDRKCIIMVQCCARRRFAQEDTHKLRYQRGTRCATLVQACWLRYMSRVQYLNCRSDIVTVQKIARSLLAKKEMRRLVRKRHERCAILLQKSWRGYQEYKNYFIALADIVTVQSVARRLFVTREFQQLVKERNDSCATIVQVAWRRFFKRRVFCQTLAHIIKVQSVTRRLFATRELKELQNNRRWNAAVALQKTWRLYFCWTNYQFILADVTIAQCQVRQYLARKKFSKLLEARQNSCAIGFQSAWRYYFCKTNYQLLRSDIITAQVHVRIYLARKQYKLKLNAHKRNCAVIIQKMWRKHFCRTNFEFMLSNIIIAQCQVRQYFARKELARRMRCLRNISATEIQTKWRSYFALSNYSFIYADILIVQSVARSLIARRTRDQMLQEKRTKAAIVKVQSVARILFARMTRDQLLQEKRTTAAIVKVQSIARSLMARRTRDQLFKEKRTLAAITIESIWRCHASKKSFMMYKSARKIQCCWRGYFVFTTYVILYSDIVKVQCIARSMLAKREFKSKMLERRSNAALWIQKAFRGMLDRAVAVERKQAILAIQRLSRGYIARVELYHAWKEHVEKINYAATQIQKDWRCHFQRQQHMYVVGSVIQIQSICRMIIVKKCIRRQQEAATLIQAVQRRFRGRILLLDLISVMLLHKAREYPGGSAATKIQCLWRQKCLQQRVQVRKATKEKLIHNSSIRIAAFFMTVKCLRTYSRMVKVKRTNSAASTIQLWYRAARKVRAIRHNNAAKTIQVWYRVATRVRGYRRNHAALKIYKFLKMVKAEVDREIRAEKKRRKFREKMRNRTKHDDELMLEGAFSKLTEKIAGSAWVKVLHADPQPNRKISHETNERPRRSNSMQSKTTEPKSISRSASRERRHSRRHSEGLSRRCDSMKSEASEENFDGRHGTPSGSRSGSGDAVFRSRVDSSISDALDERTFAPIVSCHSSSKQRINTTLPPVPPSYYNFHYVNDRDYEIPFSAAAYRLPPPRMKTFNRVQIEQDLSLEEAYLDVEISGAKQRRMEDKIMKQQQKRSRSTTGSRTTRPRAVSGSIRSSPSSRARGTRTSGRTGTSTIDAARAISCSRPARSSSSELDDSSLRRGKSPSNDSSSQHSGSIRSSRTPLL